MAEPQAAQAWREDAENMKAISGIKPRLPTITPQTAGEALHTEAEQKQHNQIWQGIKLQIQDNSRASIRKLCKAGQLTCSKGHKFAEIEQSAIYCPTCRLLLPKTVVKANLSHYLHQKAHSKAYFTGRRLAEYYRQLKGRGFCSKEAKNFLRFRAFKKGERHLLSILEKPYKIRVKTIRYDYVPIGRAITPKVRLSE